MKFLTNKMSIILLAALFCTFQFSSCTKDDDEMDDPTEQEIIDELISEVRSLTAAFHDINKAIEAGWANDLSGCVAHPTEGGMGHHYARMEYIDGRVNHLEPQILLYESHLDGTYEFLGVEYIVPFAILPADADPPELFFHKFHANPALELWALHVWTEKENPKGMFYDWNPNVICRQQIIDQQISEVRTLTADFHDINMGIAAGWANDLSGCVEHPTEGGMGHHYARMEYIDGWVNHLEPQILLYEPHPDGSFEFVGVEYIVPFAILPEDAEPPELFFHKFHKNPVQEIWALHVWTEKENPNGMFADWNPNVTCN